MTVYNIGDKVTIRISPSLYPSISRLNGHILVVSDKINFGGGIMYSLRWEQEDNLGRSCDFPIGSVAWSDEELIPCFNTPIAKIFYRKGLPDI